MRWKRENKTLWTCGELAIERQGDMFELYRGRKLVTAPFAALDAAQTYAKGLQP